MKDDRLKEKAAGTFRGGIARDGKLNTHDGFTLIEMLLVVTIIAVLVAVSIPMVTGTLERARVATDMANERVARTAAITEYMTEGTFGGQPCDSGFSVIAYYDAAKGKWVDKRDGIQSYGKCIKTHGHKADILEGIWNPADGMVYLRWPKAGNVIDSLSNVGDPSDPPDTPDELSLQGEESLPEAQSSGDAPSPGLCSESGCQHTTTGFLVRTKAEEEGYDQNSLHNVICKDCGQWVHKAGDAGAT